MENRIVLSVLIFGIILIAGCIESKVDYYSPNNNCSDISSAHFDNPACDRKCASYEICTKSVTLPTSDGKGERQCYTCFNADITGDYLRLMFIGDKNSLTSGNGSVELRWNISGNTTKIKSVSASDKFKGSENNYDAEFDRENSQVILRKILEPGQHVIKAQAHLADNSVVESEDVKVLSEQETRVYCCTNDYRSYWDNAPKTGVNECLDLGEPEGRIGYSTPIEAEHDCIFGFICQPDGTMKKVRGKEHVDAVNSRKTVYPNPEGINCPNMTSSSGNEQPKTVYNVNFEFLDIGKGYAKVEKLPYGSSVHFVVASNTVDMTKQLPITITMKVNDEKVFEKTIPNEPDYNCRGPTGCSIDGPMVLSEWNGKRIVIAARNKDGELLVEYKE